jgi:hypothetical protein
MFDDDILLTMLLRPIRLWLYRRQYEHFQLGLSILPENGVFTKSDLNPGRSIVEIT